MLGDDVLLYLVRAAIDRCLAIIEVLERRFCLCIISDLFDLWKIHIVSISQLGQSVISISLEEQFIQHLLNDCPFDF